MVTDNSQALVHNVVKGLLRLLGQVKQTLQTF